MRIPNYVLQARRLNTPSDLPAPPAPNSLVEVDRDAWVLQSYVKETRSRSFLYGATAGFVAAVLAAFTTAHLFIGPRLPNAVARVAPAALHAQTQPPVVVAQLAAPTHPAMPAPEVVASAPRGPVLIASGAAALPLPSNLPMPPAMPSPALTPAPAPVPHPAAQVAAQKIEAVRKPVAKVEVRSPVPAKAQSRKEERPAPRPLGGEPDSGHSAPRASGGEPTPEMNRADSARAPVIYVARSARTEPPPEVSQRTADTPQVTKPKPTWTLVGTPTNKFALIAVSGGGGQTVLPVQVGQKLPDGSVLEAVQPGQIATSSGSYFTHH